MLPKKKILLLTLEFPPAFGGVGRMYEKLFSQSPAEAVTVWSPAPPADGGGKPYRFLSKPLLARSGWPRWRTTFFELRNFLHSQPETIVVVGHILPLGIPVWLLSYWYKFSYVVIVHGMDVTGPLLKHRQFWMIRRIMHRAKAVIAANQYIGGVVRNAGIPQQKIHLIYPSPTLERSAQVTRGEARHHLSMADDDLVILTVGRLVARKNHADVIEAIHKLGSELPNLRYVIIGDGPERAQLSRRAEQLAPGVVTLMGALGDTETALWLAAADLFVMTPKQVPGDVEGLGIVYVEAQSFGLPVIASNSGGVVEALLPGETGLLVEEGNVEALCGAIRTLALDAELRHRFGERGRRWVAEQFSAAKSWEKFSAIVASL